MNYKVKKNLIAIVLIFSINSNLASAEVYGGGYWEAIGFGNMQCADFNAQDNQASYKELAAVWLSGFMSGVNFSSEDVYDITWGEDVYLLTDLVIKRCQGNPDKLISDVATQIVYNRYKDKNFTATKDVSDK